MNKWIIILASLVVLGGVGGFAYVKFNGSGQDAAKVSTAKAKIDRIKMTVSPTGLVAAMLDIDVKCKASGQVIRMPKHGPVGSTQSDEAASPSTTAPDSSVLSYNEPMLEVSDVVKKGQLLVKLDPIDMVRIRDQAKVQLDVSRAKRVIAENNLEICRQTWDTDKRRADSALAAAVVAAADAHAKSARQESLLVKEMAAKEDVETARTAATQADTTLDGSRVKLRELETQKLNVALREQDLNQAVAAVQNDQINLAIAEDRLADTTIYAPRDGTVSVCTVQIGTIITSAISNVGGGTTVLTLSDLSRIFVLASVDESEVGRVAVGQKVAITADAFKGEKFAGKVTRVATRGANTSNVVTFEVQIEVLSPNKSLLKPTMTANVEITTDEKDAALVVPADALFSKTASDSGQARQGGGAASAGSQDGPTTQPKATSRGSRAGSGGGKYITVINAAGEQEDRKVKVGLNNGVMAEILDGLKENEDVVVRRNADSKWNASQQRGGPPNPFGGSSSSSSSGRPR
jgi:HlyD family secretion protein